MAVCRRYGEFVWCNVCIDFKFTLDRYSSGGLMHVILRLKNAGKILQFLVLCSLPVILM